MQANNLYVYCGNNPFVYVDPNGESIIGAIAIGTLLVGGLLGLTSCGSTSVEDFAKEARLNGNYVVFGSDTKSSGRLSYQMDKRGWSISSVNQLVNNPYTTRSSFNKATGNSATAYYDAEGNYVIIDDVTHAVVQISDKNDPDWIPDSSINDPYMP